MASVRPPLAREDVRSGIVEAAAQLLRRSGAGAVTTRAVAEAAGVQAPTIYRLFGDKDGLIDAIAEEAMASYVAAKRAKAGDQSRDSDPVSELRAAWHDHVEFGLANPELYALISSRSVGSPSPATRAGIEVLRGRIRRIAASGLLRVSEERALSMVHAAGNGTVLALLSQPRETRDRGLAGAMFDSVCSGLLIDAPTTAVSGPTAVTVAFAATLSEVPGLSDAERGLMAEWLARSIRALHEA